MAFAVTARAYGWYADGTDAAMVALRPENGILSLPRDVDQSVVLRYGIQESGSGSFSGATTDDYQLQYNLNSVGWNNVTGASAVAQAWASANLTDAGTTVQRLSSGSGSFVAGEISEAGLVTDRQLTANNFSELVYTVKFLSAGIAAGDVVQFRVLLNGATFTYSVTPTFSASKVQAVAAAESSTVAVAKNTAKGIAASVTGTMAMVRLKSVAQVIAATVGAAVALQRGVGHGIAATVGGVVALSRRTATTVAATSTATIAVARVKAALVIIAAATTVTAALSRTTTKVLAVGASMAAVLDKVKTSVNQDYPQAIDAATDLAVSLGRGMGKVIDLAVAIVAKVMTGTPAAGRINGPTHSSTSNGKTESTLGPAPTKAIQDVDVGV